jgi:hypothetical protein
MSCFDNFIGKRRGAGVTPPLSGRWMEDIPGINLKRADAVADTDLLTSDALLDRCISNAIQEVKDALRTRLSAKYTLNQVTEVVTTSKFSSITYKDGQNGKGVNLRIGQDACLPTKMYITEIRWKSGEDIEDKQITIYDGGESSTITVSSQAGEIGHKIINYEIKSDKVRMAWDAQGMEVGQSVCAYSSCICDCKGGHKVEILSTDFNGLSMTLTERCDMERFFCMIGDLLGAAAWNIAGFYFYHELLNADRWNEYVIFGRAQSEGMKTELKAKGMQELETLVKSIDKLAGKYAPCCFSCDKNTWVYDLP